ncbi:hypothetical protein [Paenibacillus sp. FSL L8-0708]
MKDLFGDNGRSKGSLSGQRSHTGKSDAQRLQGQHEVDGKNPKPGFPAS